MLWVVSRELLDDSFRVIRADRYPSSNDRYTDSNSRSSSSTRSWLFFCSGSSRPRPSVLRFRTGELICDRHRDLSLTTTTNDRSWWGPKLLSFFLLSFLAFLIPNEFFMFYGRYIVPIGAFVFILIGLILLIDFAHNWSETCLDRWESSETNSNLWQLILVGSTFGLYLGAIVMTTVLYIFFAGSGCGTNTFFITFNLILSILVTLLSIAPPVQEANPKSGLAQASMVAAYCTYLTASAVANHNDDGHGECNPLHRSGTKRTTVLLGALFTFLAIAYSTSRAATQSKALVGKGKNVGPIALPDGDGEDEEGHVRMVTSQPKPRKDEMRYQAIKAAVDAGYVTRFRRTGPDRS